jgi:hypothetical protein
MNEYPAAHIRLFVSVVVFVGVDGNSPAPRPSPLRLALRRAGEGEFDLPSMQGAMHVGRALHLIGMGLPSTNCATNERIPRRPHSFIRERGRIRGRGRELTGASPLAAPACASPRGGGEFDLPPTQGAMHVGRALHLIDMGLPSTNCATNERIPCRSYSFIRERGRIRGRDGAWAWTGTHRRLAPRRSGLRFAAQGGEFDLPSMQGAMHVGRALHLVGMGLPSTNCATNERISRRSYSFIRDRIRGRDGAIPASHRGRWRDAAPPS